MKLCKDCKYFTRDVRPQCNHQNNNSMNFDYVDGEQKNSPIFWQAHYLRNNGDYCAPEGIWFEPREKIGAESEQFLYGRDEREPKPEPDIDYADDPRHGQAADLNKLR